MSKPPRHFLSVIIPAFRQEKTIVRDIRNIAGVLDQIRYPYEIIVVVDGFADRTYDRIAAYSRKGTRLVITGYATNKGKGYAVRFGMARSHGDVIAFIDSGMELNPNGLSMCLEHFEWYNADIIVGSKRHQASKVNYPWQRRVLSRGYQLLTRLLFGLNIRDTQVGLKFFRRDVLEKVLPRLLVKRYAFDIEMLAVAYSLGFTRIYEAPVDVKLDFDRTSPLVSQKFLRTVFLMMVDTLAVFYRLRLRHYYRDGNQRKWRFDPELSFRINIG
jgi:glycosyltransferase involved in cell wall biosynthesis